MELNGPSMGGGTLWERTMDTVACRWLTSPQQIEEGYRSRLGHAGSLCEGLDLLMLRVRVPLIAGLLGTGLGEGLGLGLGTGLGEGLRLGLGLGTGLGELM